MAKDEVVRVAMLTHDTRRADDDSSASARVNRMQAARPRVTVQRAVSVRRVFRPRPMGERDVKNKTLEHKA